MFNLNVFIYFCVLVEIILKEKKKNFIENEFFRFSYIFFVIVVKKIENILWLKVEKNFKWKGVGGFFLIFILYLLYWYKFLLLFSFFLVGK